MGFNAKVANELTTDSRIEAVKSASEAVKV